MANNSGDINIKAILDSTQVDTSLLGLKKSLRELSSIKVDVLPKRDADAVRARIGEIINETKDLRESLSTLDKGDFAQNITKLMTPLVGGFTAAGSVAQLFGLENEKINKILEKTQQLTVGLMAIQQLADSDKLKSTALYVGQQIKSVFWTGKQVVATEGATIAQKALNIAMNLNPVGLIIAGITALVAILVIFNRSQKETSQNEIESQKAMDGTIIKSDELRKSYNDHIKTMRDLDIEYRLVIGTITEFGATIENINNNATDSMNELTSTMYKDLGEIDDAYSGFFGTIREFFDDYWSEIIGKESNQQQKINEVLKTNFDGQVKLEEDKNEKLKLATAKYQRDVQKSITDYNVKKLNETISALDSEYKAYLESTKRITELYRQLAEKQKSFRFGYLTPEEQEIQTASDYFDNYTAGLNEINEKLQVEKDLQKEIGIQIESSEKQLRKYSGTQNKIGEEYNWQLDNLSGQLAKKQTDYNFYLNELTKLEARGKPVKTQKGNAIMYDENVSNAMDFNREKLEILNNELLQIELQITEIGVAQLETEQQKYDITKKISDLKKDEIKNNAEISKLETEQKKIQSSLTTIDPIANEELKQKKIQEIKDKYRKLEKLTELERINNILNDDKEIQNIRLQYLDELVKNEGLDDTTRLNAEKERNKLLDEQKVILGQILEIKKQEIDLNETLSEDEKTSKKKLLDKQTEAEIKDLDTKTDLIKEKAKIVRDQLIDIFADFGLLITDVISRNISFVFDNLFKNLDRETERMRKSLDSQLKGGLIDQQKYDDEILKLEEDKEKKSYDLKVKQFRQEKALNLVKIAMDTAVGIAKSWGQGGGLLGLPLAGITALAGAFQLAFVASQQPPQYEMGGLIKGKSHINGGVPLVAEGNEFIVNKKAVARPGVLDLLNNINNGGGSNSGNMMIDESTLRKIVMGISSIPVINVESNTTNVQRKVKNIETRGLY